MTFPDPDGDTRHRARFTIVALGALILCTAYVWRGAFSSDFWEHAAVVRELAARPMAPQHPLLRVDAPHAYVSPYLLAVGLAARAFDMPPILALALAGLVNVVLLAVAFRRFLVRLLPNGAAAAPYALLLIIFFWGKDPWMWSGFLHVGMLGYDVSYPSTFVLAASFLALSLLLEALDRGTRLPFLLLALLVTLCFITHPPTALVLLVGLGGLLIARVRGRVVQQAALLAGAAAVGVAASLAWPYFPMLDLFTDQPPEFHSWSGVFYQDVVGRVWPLILGLPLLLWRAWANPRDPLVLVVVLLAGIYAIGALTGAYGLGRTIAYLALFVQVALGAALAVWELYLPIGRRWFVPALTLVALAALFMYNRPPLPRLIKYERPSWRDAMTLLRPVAPGDVVLADSPTSYWVPALTGGRVLAWRHPVYWVPDHAERRQAQEHFFGAATDEERRAILRRYPARWLLLNSRTTPVNRAEHERLLSLGCIVDQHRSLVLIDLARTCVPHPEGTTAPPGLGAARGPCAAPWREAKTPDSVSGDLAALAP